MPTDRQLWYNVAIIDGLGPSALQKIHRRLNELKCGPEILLSKSEEWLSSELSISTSLAESVKIQLERLLDPPQTESPSRLLLPSDEGFPAHRMAEAVPPLPAMLWAAGDTSLLGEGVATVGIAGSRDASDQIIEFTREFASKASRSGICVVSGLAAGVDTAAHEGALIGRSGTIGVMASGINRHKGFVPADELESICFVSQFSPNEPWSGPRAMQRNSTIAALSDRVVVMAAGKSGGSWEMAQLCLKRKKPLFVLDVEPDVSEGNQMLIRAGAIPFCKDNLEVCWQSEVECEPQLSLFD
jgi:DNA processing protein